MIKILFIIKTCAAVFIAIETLVPILALKRSSNVDGFMLENKRTRTRQNYVLQSELNNDVDIADNGITYITEPLDVNANPEELPALFEDYANMIRNDIILLDNSVETRTRKRGNLKVQKDLTRVPCTCEEENKDIMFLGVEYVPQSLETRRCNKSLCHPDHRCHGRRHDITVLKRRTDEDALQDNLPDDLKDRWVTVKQPVTIGCYCAKNH